MSVGVLKLSGFEISGLRNTIDLSAVMGRGDSQVSSTPLDPMALRFALDQLRRRQGGLGNEARAGLGGVLFGRSPAQRQGIVCAPFEGSYKDFLGSLWNNQVASLNDGGVFIVGDLRLNFPQKLEWKRHANLFDGLSASLQTTTPWTLEIPSIGQISFQPGVEIQIGQELRIIGTSTRESIFTIHGCQVFLQSNVRHMLTFDEKGLKELSLTLARPLTIRIGSRLLVSDEIYLSLLYGGLNFKLKEDILIGSAACKLSFKKGQSFRTSSSPVENLNIYNATLTLSDGRTISFERDTNAQIDPATEAILKVTTEGCVIDDRGMKITLTGELPLVDGRLTEIKGTLTENYRVDDENVFSVHSKVTVHSDGSRTLVIRGNGNILMGEKLSYDQVYTVIVSADGQVTDCS